MTKVSQLWAQVSTRSDELAERGSRLLINGERRTYRRALEEAPDVGGVYAVFKGQKLLYVGESADLRHRLGNLKRTRTHTLRRSVGKECFHASIGAKGKFPDRIEARLDQFLFRKCRYCFLPVRFGRKEIESWSIRTRKPRHNAGDNE